MSIYRGAGGSGDATNDATVSQVQTYASQAATSATNAASSATAAAASASGAATSATLATAAKNDSQAIATTVAGYVAGALASETAADVSATEAAASAAAAAISEGGASGSASDALDSANTATTQASNATTSATNSANSAASALAIYGNTTAMNTAVTNAGNSATSAATSATNAATSATAAASSASAASTSASAASGSVTAAATSAANANTSASSAASSASSASGSATIATTQASNASTSAAAASNSATNAATSAITATTQAGIATTGATTATTQAGIATTQADIATTQATSATSSAITATTQAFNASTSATNASSSETNSLANRNAAATSATAASTSASAASTSATSSATSASAAATSAAAASAVALGNEPVRHSVRPSLLLDFANTKQLDPRITFTRASTATFYDGRTTAVAEQNLFQYSQDYTASSGSGGWAKYTTTITANTTVAPDGTTTASTLTSSGTAIPRVAQTKISTGTYVFSIYLKQGTDRYIQLIDTAFGTDYANFDLQTGVVTVTGAGVTSSITSVGNGWYRCTISRSITGSFDFAFGFTDNNPTASYAPTLTNTGLTTFAWGAQLEQRSSVTAYTPTTTATITNYIPALQTAASGVARFDHNPTTGESLGLLIEEQRTNIVTYSDDFSNAAWNKNNATIITNQAISPDGTLSSDLYIPTVTGSTIFQGGVTKAASALPYTVSLYAKANGLSALRFYLHGATNGNRGDATFDLSTGTVTVVSSVGTFTNTTATMTLVGNNWYRCTISTTTNTDTALQLVLRFDGTTNGFSGFNIWGAQLEAGAFATSYIPTVASQVTRSPDAASMTGTNFSSWYRQDEGTVYSETFNAQTVPASTFPGVWRMNDGANNNRISLYITSAATYVGVVRGGSAQGTTVNIITTANTSLKNAYVYKSKDFAMSTNAGTVATVSSGEIPILTQFLLSTGDEAGKQLWHKKLAYYPKRLTNAELQGLTTV